MSLQIFAVVRHNQGNYTLPDIYGAVTRFNLAETTRLSLHEVEAKQQNPNLVKAPGGGS